MPGAGAGASLKAGSGPAGRCRHAAAHLRPKGLPASAAPAGGGKARPAWQRCGRIRYGTGRKINPEQYDKNTTQTGDDLCRICLEKRRKPLRMLDSCFLENRGNRFISGGHDYTNFADRTRQGPVPRRDRAHISDNVINSYYFKPTPLFYGEGSRFFGVKLEIDGAGKSGNKASRLLEIANSSGRSLLYIKHDGSLDDCLELCPIPFPCPSTQRRCRGRRSSIRRPAGAIPAIRPEPAASMSM